ncbi:hypothetical protein FHL15_002409 [Xylaria flabelliformis]|uniref:Uncharacterized protein n=1 Tax=Xylaria flabelliformis TaxID=2512241 RepID=A0A553I960_9PEZI|nr:hypothetical protein FHL15_002409 [Xylaria flabelliformis]
MPIAPVPPTVSDSPLVGPEAYKKALALVGVRPEQAVMVAAHAYDLRAAKALSMHTLYVYRWTDDITEDMNLVRRKNENLLNDDGMGSLVDVIRAICHVVTGTLKGKFIYAINSLIGWYSSYT